MAKNYILAISRDLGKLSQRSEEVNILKEYRHVANVISELKETIRANKDLVALSASQIGYFDRIFCINFNNDIRAFVNPVITKTEGLKFVREKSPSIPDKEYIVPRSETVYAVYQQPNGTPESNKFEGPVAEIFQHQVDMLDGVFISDFGLEVLPEFDLATEEDKKSLIKEYIKFLRRKEKKLNKEIDNDLDLKKIVDGAKFINAVAKGEVELEKRESDLVDPKKMN